MCAKKFLSQNYLLEKEVMLLQEQLARANALAEKCTASYGRMKVQTSGQGGLDSAFIRIQRVREELNAAIIRLQDTRRAIEETISQVSNDKSRLVLEYRYLCCKKGMESIAAELDISRSYAYVLEAAGLREVEQILIGRSNHVA